MLFNLKNPYDLDRFWSYVRQLAEDQSLVIVKKKYKNRTLKQNSYLHLILAFFASQYGCTADEAKLDYFKKLCNKDIFVSKKKNRFGVEVTTCRSSADLDTKEMTIAIERFRNWASQYCYIPAPNEREALIYAEQQIEENKEFI